MLKKLGSIIGLTLNAKAKADVVAGAPSGSDYQPYCSHEEAVRKRKAGKAKKAARKARKRNRR